jgi:hypothetical protein
MPRPRLVFDVEKARRLYVDRGLSQRRVAELLGLHGGGGAHAVGAALRRIGIPSRGRGSKPDGKIGSLYAMYLEGHTLEEIGYVVGISRQAVWDRFYRAGLARRPRGYRRKKAPASNSLTL